MIRREGEAVNGWRNELHGVGRGENEYLFVEGAVITGGFGTEDEGHGGGDDDRIRRIEWDARGNFIDI